MHLPRYGRLLAAAALAASSLAIGAAHADPISGSQPLTVAGVTFSNFGCTLNGGGFATPGKCSQISVGANPSGNGIQFTSGFDALGIGFKDAVINYAASDAAGITGVSLGFNGAFKSFDGFAVSEVTETIRDAATNKQVGFLDVACGTDAGCVLNDPSQGFMSLGGSYTNLVVEKDIYVGAFDGDASISIIDQGYQTNVPEPASMALLGAGLVGVGLTRRRKQAVA